jgi:hypothetical protein
MRLSFLFLILICARVNGQVAEKTIADLREIQTIEQASQYLAEHSAVSGELFELSSRADSSYFDKSLISTSAGTLNVYDSEDKKSYDIFKTLESHQSRSFRVQYIFLDNKKLGLSQIDSIRNLILKRANAGEPFDKLAKEYSMDGNAQNGGDLGWFEEGMMKKEFEESIKGRQTGEIFKVDIPSEKWYYVVKNTNNPRLDTTVTILYVQVSAAR